ncbi:GntR family transcriptional regulator [Ramlibacter sp. G-1-2-2]|uniref:GntR family transcriptional regulator n=1 Tax=Ramlibacter agri TaxID=2728837 RepID=A0A848GV87_9BURK|nr:GntR family transcriptional regulator [Ramlibacter agri]NML42264.1 GntR family transcriptional regulator [Ramlibacter agri]
MTMRLNRDQGDLLHKQLFLALREQISRGVYPQGSAIPSEDQLGRLFGVSRITVRRAVTELVDAGWVEKRSGRGTFVLARSDAADAGPPLSLVESFMRRSRQTQARVLELSRRIPPPAIANALQLASQEAAVFVSRLRSIGQVPLLAMDAWIVAEQAVHITVERLRHQGLSETLLAHGARFTQVSQSIDAVAAEPHVASLLQVGIGSPLLRIERLMREAPAKPVMHMTAYLSSKRSTIQAELTADTLEAQEYGQLVHRVGRSKIR